MRFWITKNSELPVHEQLVRQVILGILSEDLPAGTKLPSVRALARRHHIHSNTVSAAYHDLLQKGWLELRRGSGLYVRNAHASPDRQGGLESLLTTLLQSARSLGHAPEEVLRELEHLVRPRTYERVLIVEPESGMREILQVELSGHLDISVEAAETPNFQNDSEAAQTLIVALPTRAEKVRAGLPDGARCMVLRLRSARESLEGQTRPGPDVVISIVISLELDPEALCEVDAAIPGWQDRIGRNTLVVADVVAARELRAGCHAEVLRVIADSSLAELKQCCRV
jgi:DNA-binding transcriptional regulator YhcF (GntR family)